MGFIIKSANGLLLIDGLCSSSGNRSNSFELTEEDMSKISKFIMENIIKNKKH